MHFVQSLQNDIAMKYWYLAFAFTSENRANNSVFIYTQDSCKYIWNIVDNEPSNSHVIQCWPPWESTWPFVYTSKDKWMRKNRVLDLIKYRVICRVVSRTTRRGALQTWRTPLSITQRWMDHSSTGDVIMGSY